MFEMEFQVIDTWYLRSLSKNFMFEMEFQGIDTWYLRSLSENFMFEMEFQGIDTWSGPSAPRTRPRGRADQPGSTRSLITILKKTFVETFLKSVSCHCIKDWLEKSRDKILHEMEACHSGHCPCLLNRNIVGSRRRQNVIFKVLMYT
jgi:hypothetical protein